MKLKLLLSELLDDIKLFINLNFLPNSRIKEESMTDIIMDKIIYNYY